MDTTYGMACPVCVWMVDNRPTTEHVEREYLAHVRAQHPENVERVVADATDVHRPRCRIGGFG